MKRFRDSRRAAIATAIVLGVSSAGVQATHAAQPQVTTDDGAFVRILGNPADDTIKFQYGWSKNTPSSDAAGYWVGVYDVTRSHYVWSGDTGAVDLPDQLSRNASPTADLPNGEYKVVFFVRETYTEPVSNIAEIEAPFVVNHLMM